MERWLETGQDRVWTGTTVKNLEERFDRSVGHRETLRLAASLAEGTTVLDAGCGFGHLYPHLTVEKPGIKYLGVDQSREMLKRARIRNPGVQFIEANLYRLRLKPVDTVIAIDVLHHQPSLEPLFSILLRLAKRTFIAALWIHERYKQGEHEKMTVGGVGEIIHWYTEEELRSRFSDLQYEVHRSVGCRWRDIYKFELPDLKQAASHY